MLINLFTKARLMRFLLQCALILLALAAFTEASPAQRTAQERKTASMVWINTFYGPNNSGVGIATRYGVIGIGATVFNFAGDTTLNMPPRPGAIALSGDIYLAADFSDWFALYGNIGYAGRLTTYKEQREQLRDSPQRDFLSLGGGLQLSIASHLVLGAGYNLIIDTPDYQGDPTDDPIQSAIAQVGYRF